MDKFLIRLKAFGEAIGSPPTIDYANLHVGASFKLDSSIYELVQKTIEIGEQAIQGWGAVVSSQPGLVEWEGSTGEVVAESIHLEDLALPIVEYHAKVKLRLAAQALEKSNKL